jgi:hypothetical protein
MRPAQAGRIVVRSGGGGDLIERWNGQAWAQAPGPAPAGDGLAGVAVTSTTNAWAVGCTASCTKTLILRWNGANWK